MIATPISTFSIADATNEEAEGSRPIIKDRERRDKVEEREAPKDNKNKPSADNGASWENYIPAQYRDFGAGNGDYGGGN